MVKIEYLNFDSIKICNIYKVGFSTSQRRAHITYKIDSAANGNLMQFKTFKTLFPMSTIEVLHATNNDVIVLKNIYSD